MTITLNEAEYGELLKQDPETKGNGGFQKLMVDLAQATDETTLELDLTTDHLEKIPRYAFDYNNGGWEDRLVNAFSRHLGPNLGR